jgi:hypothetical protein
MPPEPARSKRTRGKSLITIMGGMILLGLFCLVIGLMKTGGDLSSLSFFSTQTPTPTQTYTPTNMPIPTPIYTSTPEWAININDTFDSNKYSWPMIDNVSYSCGIENMYMQDGKLIWDLAASKSCSWNEIPKKTGIFGDFSFFIDVQRISGPTNSDYGVIFRDLSGQHYFFTITDSLQQYSLSIYQQNNWSSLINWTPSSAIRNDAVNRLGVVFRGSQIQLFINGTMVASYSNDVLPSGGIGVIADTGDSGTELKLEYDNLELGWNPYVQNNP